MITAEQIPHGAYLAAHEVMGDDTNGFTLCEAIAAALNAWPGVWEYKYHDDGSLALILPLPKDDHTLVSLFNDFNDEAMND
jgi:hypothetical protein